MPGAWSDLLDKQLSTLKTDENNVVSVRTFDGESIANAVLVGAMHAVNSEFTLPAGDSVGFKIQAAGGTFVRFANADGLTVKYVTSFTGDLQELGSSRSLNLTVDNGYRAFYSKFTNLVFSESEVILSGQAPINTEVYSDGNAYVVVKNNTAQTVSDSFSAGLQSVGAFTIPYGLQADTALTATTEMSIYD